MRGTIAETPLSEFHRLWQINVVALVDCIQQALPMLRESHGSIVNIGSLGSNAVANTMVLTLRPNLPSLQFANSYAWNSSPTACMYY